MALQETGVRLVAENERGFIAALTRSTKAVDSFQDGTQRASVGTIALGTAVGNLITGGLSLVASTATSAGRALAGFVTSGIQDAAALEAQMSGIAAVTGASAEEMDALQDLIINLGLDPSLTVSTVEAAQAIELLGKNGVSVTEILDGMALSVVQLANSTGADFATAADISTDVMAVFESQGISMADAVNGITGVVNSSKFDINDYALALANGAAVANATGVEFEDFNNAIAATSFNFTSGQTAGTAFRNLLTRLTPSTEKATEEMQALGLITADGTNNFFDAEGNLKSMNDIAILLSDSLGGLSEAQKSATLETIFGADASGAAIALAQVGQSVYTDTATAMDQLGLSFEEATALIEAGGTEFAATSILMARTDAADSAATRVDNFAGAMDILSGVIEAVKIQIGGQFLPVLSDLASRVSSFVESNSQPFIDFFGSVATGIGTFIDQLSQGETPLFSFLGALESIGVPGETLNSIRETALAIGDFITQASLFVNEHSEALKGALIGIGIALAGAGIIAGITTIVGLIGALFNPITLIIGAAALLGAAWAENWGGIREKTEAVVNFIRPFIVEAITFIRAFWAENGDAILTKAGEIWTGFQTAVSTALLFVRDQIIVPVLTFLVKFWQENGEQIIETATAVWTFVKDWISTTLKNLQTIFKAFKAAFEGDWKSFGELLREVWDRTWTFLKDKVGTIGAQILLAISTLIGNMIDKFLKTDWNQVGIDIMNGLINGLMSMRQAVIDALIDIISAGSDAVRGFLGLESPSKLYMGFGGDSMKGYAVGAVKMADTVKNAVLGTIGAPAQALATPASSSQIFNNTSIDNRQISFSGNFAGNPTITDRDILTEVLATA